MAFKVQRGRFSRLVDWLYGRPTHLTEASAQELFLERWRDCHVARIWVSPLGRAAFGDVGERVLVAYAVERQYEVISLPKEQIRAAAQPNGIARLDVGDWEADVLLIRHLEAEWPPATW